jgi:hypothetical protein
MWKRACPAFKTARNTTWLAKPKQDRKESQDGGQGLIIKIS